MNDPRRFLRAVIATTVGTASAAAAVLALSLPNVAIAAPEAVTLYVTTTGSDANPCTNPLPCLTIQRAVVVGVDGDTINVAAGTYTPAAPIVVTESLTIQGVGAATTILDGANNKRLFQIEAGATISGFTIQNGDSDGGSGVWVNVDPNFAVSLGTVNIVNNKLLTNKATLGGFPIGSALKVDGALVNITNNIIQGNLRSAVRVASSAGATFSDNTFQNNTSTTDGAAIWLDGQSIFTVMSNTFTGNTGANGGAIAVSKLISTGVILSNTFQSNTAAELGGAIYVNGVTNTLTISANKILSNTAARGAGIGSTGPSQFLISNNEIAYNKINGAGANGGGVHFDTGAGGTLDGNQIHHNEAPTGYGGGVDVDNGGVTVIKNNVIYNNVVATTTAGAGVRVASSAATQLVGNLIYNHTANGLMVSNSASAVISNNQILTNSARSDGGGVRLVAVASFTFYSNTLSNNSVYFLETPSVPKGFGGGLHVISSTGTIEKNTFTGNKSGDYDGGGALGITERSNTTVRSNTFAANRAEFGSAVAILNPIGGSTLIDSNIMNGNLQNAPGGVEDGVIEIRGAVSHPVTVVNNLLTNNSLISFTQIAVPSTGTGVRCGEGTTAPVLIINNTFYKNGNRAINIAGTEELGSVPCSANVSIINNIIASHSTAGIKKATGTTAVLSITNNVFSDTNDTVGSSGGVNNITANPLFFSTLTNDFHLGTGSPAIDAGTNTNAPAKDIAGITRPFGVKVDAGAYEFTTAVSQTIVLNLPASKLATDAPFTVTATYSSSGAATFSAGPASICTIAANTVTLVAAGNCVVTGTAPADGSYFAATISGTIVVSKAVQIVTLGALLPKVTTDVPFSVTATFSATGPATFSAGPASVCAIAGATVTLAGSGTCAITATVASDSKYLAGSATGSFTVSKATQTISFGPLANKVVTDGQFTVVATATSNLSVTFTAGGVCTVNNGVVTLTGSSGTCTITATQVGNAVYLPAPDVPQTFNVSDPSKQNQTISFSALPPTVGVGASINLSASASSGLTVSFSSLTPSICAVSGTAASTTAAGTCTIQAAQSGNNQFNPAATVTRSVNVVAVSSSVVTGTISITGGSLSFVDTDGGSVTVDVPAGAVTGTIELVYVDQAGPVAPGTFQFAGRSFSLNAYRENGLVNDFVFQQPVTVVVQYTDAEIGSIGEDALALYFYDEASSSWSRVGITVVSRDPANNRITFQISHLTEFALGGLRQMYLPMLKKG